MNVNSVWNRRPLLCILCNIADIILGNSLYYSHKLKKVSVHNTFLSARGRKISKILIFLTTELMLFRRGNREHGNFQRGETWMVTFNINWIYLCSLNCESHLSEYCELCRRYYDDQIRSITSSEGWGWALSSYLFLFTSTVP